MTIRTGNQVFIKLEFQDKGDADYTWFAVDDEDKGRVTISPQGTGLTFPPHYVVQVDMLEA